MQSERHSSATVAGRRAASRIGLPSSPRPRAKDQERGDQRGRRAHPDRRGARDGPDGRCGSAPAPMRQAGPGPHSAHVAARIALAGEAWAQETAQGPAYVGRTETPRWAHRAQPPSLAKMESSRSAQTEKGISSMQTSPFPEALNPRPATIWVTARRNSATIVAQTSGRSTQPPRVLRRRFVVGRGDFGETLHTLIPPIL